MPVFGISALAPASSLEITQQREFEVRFDDCNANTISVLQVNGADKASVVVEGESEESYSLVPIGTTVKLIAKFIRTDQYPHLGNEEWSGYVDKTQNVTDPGCFLSEQIDGLDQKNVLVIGCGGGRDALFWAEKAKSVTAMDGTPHAVAVTLDRVAKKELLEKVDGLVCRIEALDQIDQTFDVVAGRSTFSHVALDEMKKVLAVVAPGGYFCGDFFGHNHGWSGNDTLTFVDEPQIRQLFSSEGFEIISLNETQLEVETAYDGFVNFHKIHVLARKTIPSHQS